MNLTLKRLWSCIVISGCPILLLIYHSNYNKTTNCRQKGMKYILQWTSPDYWPLKQWGTGQTEYIRRKCKINNCYVTTDRSFFPSTSEFDAVVYNSKAMVHWIYYLPGPSARSPHQKYVFVSMEASHYYPICEKKYDGFFNWTWTYRLDSDEPYGYITIRNITGDIIGPNQIMHWMKLDSMQPIDEETIRILEKKNKTAAWFVTNCKSLSKREVLVFRLQSELFKYGLEIDIFGECKWAPNKCPLENMEKCLDMIQEQYYFYLSFENSFSEDYVTEKLLTALQNYAVPVVYGGANYTRFMPDGIYLHAGKLEVSDLAKQMNDIMKDKDRYYSFFKWRNHYSYHERGEAPDSDDLCRTCEMLHDERLVKKETVYKDFRNWWNAPGVCVRKRHKKYALRIGNLKKIQTVEPLFLK